jgi:HK97 family phage prohead protease
MREIDGEDNERCRIISFSSEEPYTRWFGKEILSHEKDAVDLTRLNEIGVLLFNHQRNYVIGKIKRAWIEENRGMAEVEFDDDEDAEKIFRKVSGGTLKGVSVGYQVNAWLEVKAGEKSPDGKYTGPCSIAASWMPFEISIVSVPADATVGVDRSYGPSGSLDPKKEYMALNLYEKQVESNRNLLRR